MKKSLLILAALLAAGCAAETPIPDSSSSDARVYRRICGSCHSLPHPKRNTYAAWEHYLSLMETQMEHRGMTPMTADEKRAILRYLKEHSR